MRLWKRQRKKSWEEQAAWAVGLALEWVHRSICFAVGWTTRGILRVVSVLPVRFRMLILFGVACMLTLLAWGFAKEMFHEPIVDMGIPLDIFEKAGWNEPLERMASWKLLADTEGASSWIVPRIQWWLPWGLAILVAVIQLPAMAMAFWRNRASLVVLKIACGAFAAFWMLLLWFACRIPADLHAADPESIWLDFRNDMWIAWVLWWIPGAIFTISLIIGVSLRSVKEHYTGAHIEADPIADRVLRNFLSHGKDPRYRTSTYWSTAIHVLPILIAILLAQGCGWDWYGIPKGSGVQYITMVRVKPKKKKPKDQIILAMNSPILYYRPDIEEAKILEELDKETMDEYEATSLKSGKLGKGGGTKGGWPFGMENAIVRFIRLKYSGGDWDQDMGHGADYNFLVQFHKITGFKIARNTEYMRVNRLRRFKKDLKPPFVFITGRGGIRMSTREINTLRWYCRQEGGMIFADNGGGSFNGSFRALMRRAFPGKRAIDIPNDDIIFRQPFYFPSGAPPLWHHSGYRAVGWKHNGRWIVFYHQGDINDAWKTGHSGVKKHLAAAAYKLGINIVNYAFNQYHRIHFEK